MREREETIRRYFDAWLQNDIRPLDDIFDERIVYSECYGPLYVGLTKVKHWFSDWNAHGRVERWDIKQFIHQGAVTAVEWYFRCLYKDQTHEFDGVSLVEFTPGGRILSLREFDSDLPKLDPYPDLI